MPKPNAPTAEKTDKAPMAPEKRLRYLSRWTATLRGLEVEYTSLVTELAHAVTTDAVLPLLERVHAVHAERLAAQASIKRYSDSTPTA